MKAGGNKVRCTLTFTKEDLRSGISRIFEKSFVNTCTLVEPSTTTKTTMTTTTSTTITTTQIAQCSLPCTNGKCVIKYNFFGNRADKCDCNEGFTYNYSTGECVLSTLPDTSTETIPEPTTTTTTKLTTTKIDQCSLPCKNGQCVIKYNFFGNRADKCDCNEGFTYNYSTTMCLLITVPVTVTSRETISESTKAFETESTTTTSTSTTTTSTTTSTTTTTIKQCNLPCTNGKCVIKYNFFGYPTEECDCNEGFKYNSWTGECLLITAPVTSTATIPESTTAFETEYTTAAFETEAMTTPITTTTTTTTTSTTTITETIMTRTTDWNFAESSRITEPSTSAATTNTEASAEATEATDITESSGYNPEAYTWDTDDADIYDSDRYDVYASSNVSS